MGHDMKSRSNASTERILALLLLLLHGEHSREDIFAKIAAYERRAEPASELKMLDRDLSTLERAGVHVEHSRSGVTHYSLAMAQFERKARRKDGEQMHPTALDAAILLWIPRQPMP